MAASLRLLAFFAVLIIGEAIAQPASQRASDAIPELVFKALAVARVDDALALGLRRLEVQLDQTDASDPHSAEVPPDARRQFRATIRDALDPKRLRHDIAVEVAKGFDRRAFEVFVAAYSRPIARLMIELELLAAAPETDAAKREFIRGLESKSPDPERVKLLLMLDELTQESKIMAQSAINILARIGGISRDDPEYEELLSKARETAHRSWLATQLYAFRSVSLRDIEDFVALHEDMGVSKVVRTIGWAVTRSMEGEMRRLTTITLHMLLNALPPAASAPLSR